MWELDNKKGWASKNWWFWTVVLEKTLVSSLDCKEINQSILKEISPEYSLEGLMLKLKLQYFGHLMQRNDSLKKILMLRKIEGRRRRGRQTMRCWMASPTQWTWVWANSRRQGSINREAWCAAVAESDIGSHTVRHDLAAEQEKPSFVGQVKWDLCQ